MKILSSLLLGFALLVSTAPAADLADQVDKLAEPYIESDTIVGMTVGIIKGDQTLVRGYGHVSTDDSAVPDGKTIYEIGSVSKVFTSLLLADAMVDGRVSLVTPVQDLLPEGVTLKQRDERLPIRLWHLSTHTSGLPRLPDNMTPADPNNPYAEYDRKKLIEFLGSYEPRKRPLEEMAYSNLGLGLLGELLAMDRDTDYESLIVDRISKPLGMNDTKITLTDAEKKRLAAPHIEGGAPGFAWDLNAMAGAGALRSDVDDMLKFARAQLHPPKSPLGSAIDIAWTVQQKPIAKDDFTVGLGWNIARDGSTRWHNGQTGGFHSAVFINRKLDAAVVILTNTATMEVDVLAEQLMRMLAGQDEKPREFEKQLAVSPEKMKRYVGKYQLAPGAVFTVSTEGNKLLVGLTGQPTFRVYPKTETEWYYKVVEATLTFKLDKDGKCNAVELFQNGNRLTAKRITPAK